MKLNHPRLKCLVGSNDRVSFIFEVGLFFICSQISLKLIFIFSIKEVHPVELQVGFRTQINVEVDRIVAVVGVEAHQGAAEVVFKGAGRIRDSNNNNKVVINSSHQIIIIKEVNSKIIEEDTSSHLGVVIIKGELEDIINTTPEEIAFKTKVETTIKMGEVIKEVKVKGIIGVVVAEVGVVEDIEVYACKTTSCQKSTLVQLFMFLKSESLLTYYLLYFI